MYDARVTLQPTLHFALWFWLCNAQLVSSALPYTPDGTGPLIGATCAAQAPAQMCAQVPAQMCASPGADVAAALEPAVA